MVSISGKRLGENLGSIIRPLLERTLKQKSTETMGLTNLKQPTRRSLGQNCCHSGNSSTENKLAIIVRGSAIGGPILRVWDIPNLRYDAGAYSTHVVEAFRLCRDYRGSRASA